MLDRSAGMVIVLGKKRKEKSFESFDWLFFSRVEVSNCRIEIYPKSFQDMEDDISDNENNYLCREDDTLIWGTNVSAKQTIESFRSFLLNYTRGDEDSEPYYIKLLEEVSKDEFVW